MRTRGGGVYFNHRLGETTSPKSAHSTLEVILSVQRLCKKRTTLETSLLSFFSALLKSRKRCCATCYCSSSFSNVFFLELTNQISLLSAVSQKVFLEVKGENFRPQWRHNNLLSGRDGPQKVFFHGSFVGLDEMNKLLELEIVVKYLRKNIINFPFMLRESGREMNQVKLEQKYSFQREEF